MKKNTIVPHLILLSLFLSTQIHADINSWREENCQPYKSESIFKTIVQSASNFKFEIKYIHGNDVKDEPNGEWYDPECGFSNVTITNSEDSSFRGFIEYENGYAPKIVKVIKNNINEKYALISHFSGGTAGSYINVISLQSGKEVGDPIQDIEFTDGKIKAKQWSYQSSDDCRAKFSAFYEVTYKNDKKLTRFIKDDYYPIEVMSGLNLLKVESRDELKKECPKLDEKIIKDISGM